MFRKSGQATFSSPEPTILLASGRDRELSEYAQSICFVFSTRFDRKSVNDGLPVLDEVKALHPCHRPERSWLLGTRMVRPEVAILVQC